MYMKIYACIYASHTNRYVHFRFALPGKEKRPNLRSHVKLYGNNLYQYPSPGVITAFIKYSNSISSDQVVIRSCPRRLMEGSLWQQQIIYEHLRLDFTTRRTTTNRYQFSLLLIKFICSCFVKVPLVIF